MPHLGALADFRGAVRGMARQVGGSFLLQKNNHLVFQVKATDILAECDKLRDITLPDLGVRLEDKEGEPTVIKLVDKEELRREREEKLALEEKKRLEKEAKKAKAAAEAAEALEAAKIPPGEMFRKETDKYSAWDDKGVPTLLADGKEVPKVKVVFVNIRLDFCFQYNCALGSAEEAAETVVRSREEIQQLPEESGGPVRSNTCSSPRLTFVLFNPNIMLLPFTQTFYEFQMARFLSQLDI